MIFLRDYQGILQDVAREYFVSRIEYVSDLLSWSKENRIPLSEPAQFMKLVSKDSSTLILFIQSEIEDRMLSGIVNGLSVRFALKDTVTDIDQLLNSDKKRVVYCFLKEYARTIQELEGDEMLQDAWAIKEMEKLGYFRE